MQLSHHVPLSKPGELPLPEAGEPVPNPGEPPREPGELLPIPGDTVPEEFEKEPGEEVPEPGEGAPEEPGTERAPSGTGWNPERDSSHALRYHESGEKEADLVGEQSAI